MSNINLVPTGTSLICNLKTIGIYLSSVSDACNCHAEEMKKASMTYLLSDIDDKSVYLTGQFFRDSAINPCIESSYRFVEYIMQQVIDMHKARSCYISLLTV